MSPGVFFTIVLVSSWLVFVISGIEETVRTKRKLKELLSASGVDLRTFVWQAYNVPEKNFGFLARKIFLPLFNQLMWLSVGYFLVGLLSSLIKGYRMVYFSSYLGVLLNLNKLTIANINNAKFAEIVLSIEP